MQWEREKLLIMRSFSFSYRIFKRLLKTWRVWESVKIFYVKHSVDCKLESNAFVLEPEIF